MLCFQKKICNKLVEIFLISFSECFSQLSNQNGFSCNFFGLWIFWKWDFVFACKPVCTLSRRFVRQITLVILSELLAPINAFLLCFPWTSGLHLKRTPRRSDQARGRRGRRPCLGKRSPLRPPRHHHAPGGRRLSAIFSSSRNTFLQFNLHIVMIKTWLYRMMYRKSVSQNIENGKGK